MKEIFFIGRFPPPYGGATVKCKMLYNLLEGKHKVNKFDTEIKNSNKVLFILKLIKFIIKNKHNKGVICINTLSLFKFTKWIYIIDKKMLENMSVFVNGGSISELIDEKKYNIELLKKYKIMYVECKGMKEKLENRGLNNIEVIPNCRPTPTLRKFVERREDILRCLFISRIDEKKGVFKIINSFNKIESEKFSIDFYGPIDEQIKEKFLSQINIKDNIKYKGILDSNDEKIYSIINQYDMLIFPTEYGEGYPGIISECKIAGIPIISSEFTYSKEIIKSFENGIIMKKNTEEELIKSLLILNNDRNLLYSMRYNSYLSGEKCLIENYLSKIYENL